MKQAQEELNSGRSALIFLEFKRGKAKVQLDTASAKLQALFHEVARILAPFRSAVAQTRAELGEAKSKAGTKFCARLWRHLEELGN